MLPNNTKSADHAAYLIAKEHGNLHFGRSRVGGRIGVHKSKAQLNRHACRDLVKSFRDITNAAIQADLVMSLKACS